MRPEAEGAGGLSNAFNLRCVSSLRPGSGATSCKETRSPGSFHATVAQSRMSSVILCMALNKV